MRYVIIDNEKEEILAIIAVGWWFVVVHGRNSVSDERQGYDTHLTALGL
jgi:hypothetical protein